MHNGSEAIDLANRTLSDLATSIPGATALFRVRKLDFCCGGSVPLRAAVAEKDLDLAQLLEGLATLTAASRHLPEPETTAELIDLIETRFHEVHRRELPELIRMAKRVEAVHRDVPTAPKGLAALLDRMHQELEGHMQREEQVLFPLMRSGGHSSIANLIRRRLAEHDDHGAYLKILEELTNDFTPPVEACTTWRALFLGAQKFADDLVEHIHTENNKLFPRFAA